MELEFTAEQEELRAQVRAVLSRECPIGLVREIVEKGRTADQLWAQMVELDWPALTVAESYGGLGGTFTDLAVVVEELGRVMAPGPLFPTLTQFAPVVREVGTDRQCHSWLGAVAAGTLTGTLALAEQAGSWDLAAVRTTARADGDGWVLEGDKHFVIEAGRVDQIAVVARDDHGLGVWVVPASGVTIAPIHTLDGSRQLATVHLRNVALPDSSRLGPPAADASAQLERAVEESTVALALETVGVCQTIFDIALAYAKDRRQFGVPIGSFQAIKHKFANMLVALERARVAAYFGVATIDENDDRRALAASMAKAAAGDCQALLAQEGIQSLGGIGYTWEHDMHLYVKRAKSGEPLLGSAHEHRLRIADLVGVSQTRQGDAAALGR